MWRIIKNLNLNLNNNKKLKYKLIDKLNFYSILLLKYYRSTKITKCKTGKKNILLNSFEK